MSDAPGRYAVALGAPGSVSTPARPGAAGGVSADLAGVIERHVRPGDSVYIAFGHSRWSALARELARRYWGEPARLTVVMASLSSLGALFVEGGFVERIVTAYSGDIFPANTPNPIMQRAYESGRVQVEHWSFLTLLQRLEAAARGLPAAVTGSLAGSSMAGNPGYSEVITPYGPVSLVSPLHPDVALVHAPLADEDGNLVLAEPLLDSAWGLWAARRGVIASVERVVRREVLHGLGYRVKVPSHRVLDVVEARYGAHPGGLYAPGLPVESYGEDIEFFSGARDACRGDFATWAREWVLTCPTHESYLAKLGEGRLGELAARGVESSWQADDVAHPLDPVPRPSALEVAAALAAREVEALCGSLRADVLLAGAGLANLAAWVAAERLCQKGGSVQLIAELGMLGYQPTPADPYIFNQRCFPGTRMLSDASSILGMVVGGPATRSVACLGAAEVDALGNLNTTALADGRFLVGSGGGNDVASRAGACVVVTAARRARLVEKVAYVTSPGERVVAVVTDLGILRRLDGELRLASVPGGEAPLAERVKAFIDACGFAPPVAREVESCKPVALEEVYALRNYDRERVFLS